MCVSACLTEEHQLGLHTAGDVRLDLLSCRTDRLKAVFSSEKRSEIFWFYCVASVVLARGD